MYLMAFFNVIPSLFIFTTIFLHPIYARKPCKSSECNNGGLEIRFPFLLTDQQDESCGYPGFNLTCSEGLAAIDLPFSNRFYIREINYKTQVIKLYDPNNCLPGRIIGLNLSGSPFVGNTYRNYSFFNCPVKNLTTYWPYTVNCLSNSTNMVMAVYVENVTSFIMENCVKMVTVSVPFLENDWFPGDGFNDLWLTWDRPRCKSCETGGGVCGAKNVGSQEIVCFYNSDPGLKLLKIILMSVIFPIIAIFSCWLLFKYEMNERNWQNVNNSLRISFGSITTSPQSSTETGGGLDESTIQSYKTVILDESVCIPGLNDGTCPICLSEFLAKETVKCIPDCTHCFHSDCIDEWLRLNSSCPVCRISPAHHLDSPSINV